jgi:hypothetical protein
MKYKLFIATAVTVLAILLIIIMSSQNPNIAMNVEAESIPTGEERKVVLVELFTSEGCSSCPPADALLIDMEKNQPIPEAEIIALSQHVDYWNRLGWADPFSSSEFSDRQSRYARILKNDSIYTPQMVVDGYIEFVGSNSGKAHGAIVRAAQNPKAKIQIAQTQTKQTAQKTTLQFNIHIEDLPPISAGETADVMLAITESGLLSSVARGENAGRKIAHTAVVRKLNSVGSINHTKGTFDKTATAEIENSWSRDRLRAVVFVQERETMRVIGVAALTIAANR